MNPVSEDASFKPVMAAIRRWVVHTRPAKAFRKLRRTMRRWSIRKRAERAAKQFVVVGDRHVGLRGRLREIQQYLQAPEYIRELLRLRRVQARVRAAHKERKRSSPPKYSDSKILDLTARLGGARRFHAVPSGPCQRNRRREQPVQGNWRMAAVVAALSVGLLLALVAKGSWFDHSIETGAGEWQLVTLTDGSVIRVEPHTRLRLRFTDNNRFVDLHTGEAYFEIAKDAARPFIVRADETQVRAVGTAFGVTRHNKRVVVTVKEGQVAITHTDTDTAGDINVPASAGEQVIISDYERIVPRRVDVQTELAWARGMLICKERTTVREVAREFNRRNRVQVVFDKSLDTHPVMGTFRTNDPESFAESVARDAGMRVERHPSGVLRIVPVPQAK